MNKMDSEKEIQKQHRREIINKNISLFKSNKIGMTGLIIIIIFGFLALLSPVLFLSGLWDQKTYHPVVGYDSIESTITVIECPKTYPTAKYDSKEFCPAENERELNIVKPFNPGVEVGDELTVYLQPAPPSSKHILGTDSLGRDVFSQIMKGSQVAFLLGLLSAIVGVSISTFLGSIAAYWGGAVDAYLMRQSDLVLMLPSLPLLFIISAFAELQVWHLALVLGIIGGLGGSVITIKSQALQVKVKPFVDAARITGGSRMKILTSHILPNVAPLALLFMVFSVTGAIASESILSFLGLINIDMSWGLMISVAQSDGYMNQGLEYWWLVIPAGLAVTLLAGGFYLVGRGLDDVFNPRLRKR